MNNTPIERIFLKCIMTGEVIKYVGWDYISKRIEKAGSLELLHSTFMSRKGKRMLNSTKSTAKVATVTASAKPDSPVKKVKQTKEQSVESFNVPSGDRVTRNAQVSKDSFEASLVDGKYILAKNGKKYGEFAANTQ